MKAKIAREIGLLMLPILLIGGVAFWQSRDGAPEDLRRGQARIVTRVRQLEITPLDRYRGYTHRLAVDGWTAGDLPRVPPRRAGATKTSRVVGQRVPPLFVAFRQGKSWKNTRPANDLPSNTRKIVLLKGQVAPEIACLWMETAEGSGENREQFTGFFLLRLPNAPRVEEAVLRGRMKVDLEDRDVRMIGGVPTGDIVDQHPLFSDELRVPLELKNEAPQDDVACVPEWEVSEVTTMPPRGVMGGQMSVNLQLKRVARGAEVGRPRLVKGRLLDGKGRGVAQVISYGFGQNARRQGEQAVDVSFNMSPPLWKKLARPLTFQTALSINNGWPIEVNVELGGDGARLPPKNSRLPFIREPLPLR